jgi:PAS domain S-box-containing protein
MDCYCNPILNDKDEVILIIEQLRDITELKKVQAIQRESEERYRSIVELSPDGIIIIVDHEIVFANKEAVKMCGTPEGGIVGKDVRELLAPEYHCALNRSMNSSNKALDKSTYECELILFNNKRISVQISISHLSYKSRPALQCVIRDITESKRRINKAANIQKQSLKKDFPLPERAFMKRVYIPAETVSGDFYSVNQIDGDIVTGIIFDVSGSGITAALNVSAFNVMFNEAIHLSHKPMEIINYLNEKTSLYLGESYVAALCFSLNFKKNVADIVGAGINRFMFAPKGGDIGEVIVRGPFVGMFENSMFEETLINFSSGDRFCFFTDGFDYVFEDEEFIQEANKMDDISDIKKHIRNNYVHRSSENEHYKDDCTLLAIQIK